MFAYLVAVVVLLIFLLDALFSLSVPLILLPLPHNRLCSLSFFLLLLFLCRLACRK